jgi:hypothetical protein
MHVSSAWIFIWHFAELIFFQNPMFEKGKGLLSLLCPTNLEAYSGPAKFSPFLPSLHPVQPTSCPITQARQHSHTTLISISFFPAPLNTSAAANFSSTCCGPLSCLHTSGRVLGSKRYLVGCTCGALTPSLPHQVPNRVVILLYSACFSVRRG